MVNMICQDDFGNAVYLDHYTKRPVVDAIWVGATIPGVNAKYPIAPESKTLHKQQQIWFHEADRNCNTCKHLQRIKHPKNIAGFLYGRCTSDSPMHECSPYKLERDGSMKFHPDDPMHMECYVSRWE